MGKNKQKTLEEYRKNHPRVSITFTQEEYNSFKEYSDYAVNMQGLKLHKDAEIAKMIILSFIKRSKAKRESDK